MTQKKSKKQTSFKVKNLEDQSQEEQFTISNRNLQSIIFNS